MKKMLNENESKAQTPTHMQSRELGLTVVHVTIRV